MHFNRQTGVGLEIHDEGDDVIAENVSSSNHYFMFELKVAYLFSRMTQTSGVCMLDRKVLRSWFFDWKMFPTL